MTILTTPRLRVRRFEPTDLDELAGLLADAEVMRYLEPPFTREQTENFLKAAGLAENPLIYAVEDAENCFVGYVIYHRYDDEFDELGWVLRRDRWGQGYASELTAAMVSDVRRRGRRALIECSPDQTATRVIAEKCGFVLKSESPLAIYTL